jgi:GrpB-like predicted nucleotidyltransferase (UPF0157 family)/uncharacterized membrane protein
MATIERSVEVDRPASDVWAVLEDLRQIPIFSPSTVAVADAPERLSAVGQRFRQTVLVLGCRYESAWTVTELEPGHRVAFEGTIGLGARYCLVEQVEPLGPDRSRFTVRITYTMPMGVLGRLAGALGVQRRAQHEAEEVLANVKAHLERSPAAPEGILVGGREERLIEIVDYRPGWADRFELEADRIRHALGAGARRIEHVGSTAVPGLGAKPIIDVMVTVDDPDDEAGYLRQLEATGYVLRVREPAHRMFRTPERDVHVHVWARGSDDERRHLVFRDWLRSNPADRAAYEQKKRELAGQYRDMNDYADAKTDIIRAIMGRAEAASSGGTAELGP